MSCDTRRTGPNHKKGATFAPLPAYDAPGYCCSVPGFRILFCGFGFIAALVHAAFRHHVGLIAAAVQMD
ncbi:MAG: hypothetical protein WBM04_16280 [Candidatus Korobacteraceae bacterium]